MKILAFLLLLIPHAQAGSVLFDKIKVADEIKRNFTQGLRLSNENQTVSKKNVSLIILELYQVVNDAYHCGHTISLDLASYNFALKKLENAEKNCKHKTIFLNNIFKDLKFLKDLPTKIQNITKIRTELINWILQNCKENITQIEKSLEYHNKKFAKNDGGYDWNDNEFKNWLKDQFKNDSTPDEALAFFQDLLINEKLHPDYYVFYHATQPISVGFFYFNDIVAKLIKVSGATANVRVYNYNDGITTWLKNNQNDSYTNKGGAITNVNAIIQYMDKTYKDDTGEPVTKHLASTSYSLFGIGGDQKLSALGFFVDNQIRNPNAIGAAFDNTWEVLTKKQIPKDRYKNVIEDKFLEKNIDGHGGKKQPGYKRFPTLLQFFIEKSIVDDVVYFGGMAGARLKNRSKTNKIGEVVSAFLGNDLLEYYQDCPCGTRSGGSDTVANMENRNSLQGKISLTSQAFFDGVANGHIHILFNCLKPKEYVVLKDLKWTIGYFVEEDLLSALQDPKAELADANMPIQKLKKALQNKDTQSAALDDKLQMTTVKNIDAYEYKSAENIIDKEKPKNKSEFLQALATSLALAPISSASKQARFIDEALRGLFYMQKIPPKNITKLNILDNLNLLFDGLAKSEEIEALTTQDFLNLVSQNAFDTKNALYFNEAMADVLANCNSNIPVNIHRQANPEERKKIQRILHSIALQIANSRDTKLLDLFNANNKDNVYITCHKQECKNWICGFLESFSWGIQERLQSAKDSHKELEIRLTSKDLSAGYIKETKAQIETTEKLISSL